MAEPHANDDQEATRGARAILRASWCAVGVVAPVVVVGLFPTSLAHAGLVVALLGVCFVSSALLSRALPRVPARAALVVVIALRAPLLVTAPVLSDDVFRTIHEARASRVALDLPYRTAPANLTLPHDDDVTSRVNHPTVRAAYPPFTQIFYLVVVALGDAVRAPLFVTKAALLALDVLLILVLARARRRDDDHSPALAYGAHPLPLIALGLGPHTDVLGALLLCMALVIARAATRPRDEAIAGFLVGLGTHVKPLALLGLLEVRGRALLGAVVGLFAPALPYLLLGAPLFDGVLSYATRWRAQPIVFPLFEAVFSSWSEARARADIYTHAHIDPGNGALLIETSGRPLLSIGAIGDGARTILLDGALAARALAAVAFLCAVVVIVRKVPRARRVEGALLAYLLLTPTAHPWYFLWVLPLGALAGSSMTTLTSAAAVVLYASKVASLVDRAPPHPFIVSLVVLGALTLGWWRDRSRARLAG